MEAKRYKPGTTIANRYQVIREIGVGGMGVVLLCQDAESGATVALKVLHQNLANNVQAFRRFTDRVMQARALTHPNIVRIYDFISVDDRLHCILMEYVQGKSLRELIVSRESSGGFDFKEALSIFIKILTGMSFAHFERVVHRDIRPANVLIKESGEVKIADFGTTQVIDPNALLAQIGERGWVSGTPYYMAPEHIRGDQLSEASDVYSLGVLAFELVTGRRPFVADSPIAVAYKHLNDPFPPLPPSENVPFWFEELIKKSCAKSPGDRFVSAIEILGFLSQFVGRSLFQANLPQGVIARIDSVTAAESDERSHLEREQRAQASVTDSFRLRKADPAGRRFFKRSVLSLGLGIFIGLLCFVLFAAQQKRGAYLAELVEKGDVAGLYEELADRVESTFPRIEPTPELIEIDDDTEEGIKEEEESDSLIVPEPDGLDAMPDAVVLPPIPNAVRPMPVKAVPKSKVSKPVGRKVEDAGLPRFEYSGRMLSFDRGERKGLTLSLQFKGESIVGEATIEGMSPCRVRGSLYQNAFELELNSSELGLKLIGKRNNDTLQGTYTTSSGNKDRGQWRAQLSKDL